MYKRQRERIHLFLIEVNNEHEQIYFFSERFEHYPYIRYLYIRAKRSGLFYVPIF